MKLKFCPNCANLLYIDSTGEDNSLIYKCKNCDYKLVDNNAHGCVYKNHHNNVFLTHNITENPYIKYDVTLPRVNTIKCINNECVSNKDYKNVFILKNLNIHKFNVLEKISNSINQFKTQNLMMADPNTAIFTIDNIDDMENISIELKKWHPYFTFMDNLTPLVIFIKYDPDNLKYVYICDYCNSSWKNG